jgi:hypothetical protein
MFPAIVSGAFPDHMPNAENGTGDIHRSQGLPAVTGDGIRRASSNAPASALFTIGMAPPIFLLVTIKSGLQFAFGWRFRQGWIAATGENGRKLPLARASA